MAETNLPGCHNSVSRWTPTSLLQSLAVEQTLLTALWSLQGSKGGPVEAGQTGLDPEAEA